ncbi:hypothetical protein BG011_008652 [Mortierella polycephala]|uniref:BRCT domain-containing protein n=1 Tax=Mortierella polycephala TaxID=41804 RepID=A0A9P6TX87_9FUNG|nr:hypothetical protein BG011_008652 [Mortierella polycephala]
MRQEQSAANASQRQPSLSLHGQGEAEDGTPVGTLLWTFDCGPTFPQSMPSNTSSHLEIQTFPSLNTAMADHEREKAKRLKNAARSTDQSPEPPGNDPQSQQIATPRPSPTFSQLQRMLNIRREESALPSSQDEEETQMRPLSFLDQLPNHGVEQSQFVTPRMPSPSLRLDQSAPGSLQVPDPEQIEASRQKEASHAPTQQKRKRRLPIEDDTLQHNVKPDSSRERKKRDSRSMLHSGSPSVSTNRENGMSPTTSISDDDKNTGTYVPGAGDQEYTVESSQPLDDVISPSLVQNQDIRSHGIAKPRSDRGSHHASRATTPSTSSNEDTITIRDHNIAPNTGMPATVNQEAISCVFTGLSQEQRDAFDDNITRVINAGLFMEHIPDQVFNESATHVITSVDVGIQRRDNVGLCPRVLKYLVGMLTGAWIVRHEWFLDSIENRHWLPLPQARYLIQGDTQFGPSPGTQERRKYRLGKSLKLFDSCRMFFYGEYGNSGQKSFKKHELLKLVQCGGATALMKRPTVKASSSGVKNSSSDQRTPAQDNFSSSRSILYVTEDFKPWEVPIDKTLPIIVCDPNSIPSGQGKPDESQPSTKLSAGDLRKHGWLRDFQAVSLTWLLNCISCNVMGTDDIHTLYASDSKNSHDADEELRELDLAWTSWRNSKK